MYDRGSGSSSPAEQTVHLLAAAGRAVDVLLAERSDARGMSPRHVTVLRTLADLGPHARRDLAERMDAPPADVTRVIDDLLAQGLVQDMVVTIGGRHEVVTLTPAGTAALGAVQDDTLSVQNVLLASLTKGERTQLHYLLRRVCATAARAGAAR
ncbi:MarR family winged helix-turn-helix transcriptional regulator [Streptomyces sp. NRRL F-2580]|uniref:MarR family winged helix-turn-helix transcriptional regulator n=1 Tax=Streptomyces sp. NRRL F-2580 TaxID=1463841 RepID=UPI00068CD865|nr:MarR family winged helix-turn-helix transcriptional regulator [Streptomyces sp. NRRL F-2580]